MLSQASLNGAIADITKGLSYTEALYKGKYIPPATDYYSVTTYENTPILINLKSSDSDGEPLLYALATSPSYGSLSGAAPNFIYTPNADFYGADTCIFKVQDEMADSAAATVLITVKAVNDPPMVHNDSVTTQEDTPVTIDVLANDIDVDGDPLRVNAVTQGSNGSVTINLDNTLSYNPNADFYGTDVFTYTVSDGTSEITATVKVKVVAVNDARVFP